MSFYRTFIAAVAAMGLAASAFAADTTTQTTGDTTTQAQTTEQAAAATDAKVNVNTATAKDLMKVKGLNAAKAKAIISYRKKHGDFKTLDELKDVKGFKKMSEKNMKEVQEHLTLS